jgi:uncharacterized protein (TIGR03437 family)
MHGKSLLCLALWSASAGMAAASGPLFAVDYSEWFYDGSLATDSAGELYVLTGDIGSPSAVTKVSADGKTMLWQKTLDDTMAAMAVDSAGNVYVVPALVSVWLPLTVFVEKISADGTTVESKTPLGFDLSLKYELQPLAIAVDSAGRAYVAGYDDTKGGYVVRVNAAGAIDYTAIVADVPTSIGVDGSGSAFVVGSALTRLAPDGSIGFSVSLPPMLAYTVATVSVSANGNSVVHGSDANGGGILLGFDAQGAMIFSRPVPAGHAYQRMVMDAAGNTYVAGPTFAQWYPVRNSTAPCASVWLSVFAPDGSLLQTTYVPIPASTWLGAVATGPNSTLYLVASLDGTAFTPSQSGPVPPSYYGFLLTRLSPHDGAQTFPLACIANSATADTGPIAPGGMVTLTGGGLGPEQGIQTEATMQSPFPTQAGNVEVTFDGTPGPLLWVQDAQVNVIAPWSLTPGATTQVCVSYNDVKTNCLAWPVAQVAPGVFTVDGLYAAALNQDGTVNSPTNPAQFGSIVSIFATGLGAINPPQADGSLVGLPLPVNALPVTVDLGHCIETPFPPHMCEDPGPYNVFYAGPAPFMVAGASQINFTANMHTGTPLVLAVTPQTGQPASSNWFQLHMAGE